MVEKTRARFRSKVDDMKSKGANLNEILIGLDLELAAAEKNKTDMSLSCDTIDQAIENVLREVQILHMISSRLLKMINFF